MRSLSLIVAALLLMPAAPAAQPPTPAVLRERAADLAYNLDYPEALATLREAVAADPRDPASARRLAAVAWFTILFRSGAVLVDDYLGQTRSNVTRQAPPADLDALFRSEIARAVALSDERLRANPRDAEAHFQAGAAAGFMASYVATVEGRVLGGFRSAKRAYDEHERVLELDPRRTDAGFVVGLYRYAVSSLSPPMRLLSYIAGFGGGKERGLKLVETAASEPTSVQTDARFVLIVMYSRELRFDDALAVIGQLQRRYPRNRLLWLEAVATCLRAGRPVDARKALETGLTMLTSDRRPRGFGEEARWRYYEGATLVLLRDSAAAERALRAALASEAPSWLHGRAHKELGKLLDLAGNRAAAIAEYRTAQKLCRAGRDDECGSEVGKLIRSAYRY